MRISPFLDTKVYLAPIPASPSVSDTFGVPFCQRLWDLTKRRDNIAMAAMVAEMAADMEVHKVADKVADKVAGMVAGHGCWLIGLKLFRPKP